MADGIGSRLRAVPCGLMGALALIVSVERAIAHRIIDVTSEAASNYAYAAKAASREARGSEVLAFGDSLVKFGFQPKVIQARTGRTAFNLAAYGAPPSRDYQVLKRVIDAGGRPSALVVCFPAVHLGSTPRLHARQFSEAATVSEAWDLAWSSSDPGLFGWLMVARQVPSIRTRLELRGNLMKALLGSGSDWRECYFVFRRNWLQGRGAHLQHNDPHAPEEPAAARARALELYIGDLDANPADEPVNKRFIRRFLDLAAARDIPVFWVILPMLPAIEARQQDIRVTAITDALARQMRDAYPNLIVVDVRGRGYDARAFAPDAVHLNRRGATTFSRDLGDLIRHRLGNPTAGASWVSLPKYRPTDDAFDMEDLAQSSAVVRGAGGVRR